MVTKSVHIKMTPNMKYWNKVLAIFKSYCLCKQKRKTFKNNCNFCSVENAAGKEEIILNACLSFSMNFTHLAVCLQNLVQSASTSITWRLSSPNMLLIWSLAPSLFDMISLFSIFKTIYYLLHFSVYLFLHQHMKYS